MYEFGKGVYVPVNIQQMAEAINNTEDKKVDYWNLQAFIFMQNLKDSIRESGYPDFLNGLGNDFTPDTNYMALYKNVMHQANDPSAKPIEPEALRKALAQARYESPDIAGIAFQVLEELDVAPPKGENSEAKHERLLEAYTYEKPKCGISNPNGNADRMFSVSGVDYNPTEAGRIPYTYPFHEPRADGRQSPISTGTPVIHSGGSAISFHLFGRFNIGKKANLHGSFHEYLQSFGMRKPEGELPAPGSTGEAGPEPYPKPEDGEDFEYVYINLQKHDADVSYKDRERQAESVRSDALYREINAYNKAACLTLPADNKFFWQGFNRKAPEGDISVGTPKDMLTAIADSIANKTNDFIIPDKVLEKMYSSASIEVAEGSLRDPNKVKALIEKSFENALKEIVGPDAKLETPLDSETRSAVMTHFVKATLTDQILNATNPQKYNITCKDAIDRAGTHNLWLGINRKLDAGKPVERAEVERYLDGLAMAYKHRPANEHRDAMINAMDKFYHQLPREKQALFTDSTQPDGKWKMDEWLDNNCKAKHPIRIPVELPKQPSKDSIVQIKTSWKTKVGNFFKGIKSAFTKEPYKYEATMVVDGKSYTVERHSDNKTFIVGNENGTLSFKSAYSEVGTEILEQLESAEVAIGKGPFVAGIEKAKRDREEIAKIEEATIKFNSAHPSSKSSKTASSPAFRRSLEVMAEYGGPSADASLSGGGPGVEMLTASQESQKKGMDEVRRAKAEVRIAASAPARRASSVQPRRPTRH